MTTPTLMEQLRSAAQKAQRPQNQPLTGPILLDSSGAVWDINKQEQSLLIAHSANTVTTAFSNVLTQIQDIENVDYVAIDFNRTMFPDMDAAKLENTALDITEAHALSIDLLEELRHRVSTETWEQTILILIKDGSNLFTIRDVQKADLYMEFLTNMQAVIAVGAAFGISILMEVDNATNRANLDEDFTNVITIN